MIEIKKLIFNLNVKMQEDNYEMKDSCPAECKKDTEAKEALEGLKEIYTKSIVNPSGETLLVDDLLKVILKLQKYFYD